MKTTKFACVAVTFFMFNNVASGQVWSEKRSRTKVR
jgi:hypothetical protein